MPDLFFLQIPITTTGWLAISEHFEKSQNYLHCFGAMDGKHAVLQAPFSSGINFYNYESALGIILFALVNANYSLLFVDVGCQGRILDEGIFRNCELLSENGEGFFRFSTTNTFGRKKEASSLFLMLV
jgi:hypothetical protein